VEALHLHRQSFGHGPGLVFLHGFLGSGDNFWPHAQALKDSFTCHLLDLPGHGRSPHLACYTLKALGDEVAANLEDLGPGPFHLVGHSLGGKVACSMALRHAPLLNRVVLADISPAPTPPKHEALLKAMLAVPLAELSQRDDAEAYLRGAEPSLDVRRFLLKNLERQDNGWRWKPDVTRFQRDISALLAEKLEGPPFERPAMLIRGLRSDYVLDEDLDITRKVFPHLVVKPMDTGHWVHAEKPADFVKLVRDFLTKTD
jgi:esterase